MLHTHITAVTKFTPHNGEMAIWIDFGGSHVTLEGRADRRQN